MEILVAVKESGKEKVEIQRYFGFFIEFNWRVPPEAAISTHTQNRQREVLSSLGGYILTIYDQPAPCEEEQQAGANEPIIALKSFLSLALRDDAQCHSDDIGNDKGHRRVQIHRSVGLTVPHCGKCENTR